MIIWPYRYFLKFTLMSHKKFDQIMRNTVKASMKLPFTVRTYKFSEIIGEGGFSQVYLVDDVNYPGRKFCAKVITPMEEKIETKWAAFESEVNALSTLDHPHIIQLYDHFKDKKKFFLILEYCPNQSIHDEVTQCDGLTVERFGQVASDVVDALVYCHANGVAHRDIKPGNILLDKYNRAKIADFGLAAQTEVDELTDHFAGSLSYQAPELFQKKPHSAMMADIWALGVTFATMIMGRSPWRSDSLGGIKKLINSGKYHLTRNVPDIIQDLISKMIVVEPTDRLTMQGVADHPFFTEWKKIPKQIHDYTYQDETCKLLSCRGASQYHTHTVQQRFHSNEKEVFDTDDVISMTIAD